MQGHFARSPKAKACGKPVDSALPKDTKSPFLAHFRRPQRKISTSCGFVDILGASPGRRRWPSPKKRQTMQKICRVCTSGRQESAKEKANISTVALLSTDHVDVLGAVPQFVPKPKCRCFKGFNGFSTVSTSPTATAVYIIYLHQQFLFLGGHAYGRETLLSFLSFRAQS